MRIGRFRQAFADGRQLLMITPVNTVATSARVRHWSNSPHRGWQWSGPAGRPPPPPSPNPRRFDPLRMMRVEGEVARGKAQQARVAVCPSALGRTPGPFSCPGCRVAGWRIPLSGIWGSPTSLWANLPTTAPPPPAECVWHRGGANHDGPLPLPLPLWADPRRRHHGDVRQVGAEGAGGRADAGPGHEGAAPGRRGVALWSPLCRRGSEPHRFLGGDWIHCLGCEAEECDNCFLFIILIYHYLSFMSIHYKLGKLQDGGTESQDSRFSKRNSMFIDKRSKIIFTFTLAPSHATVGLHPQLSVPDCAAAVLLSSARPRLTAGRGEDSEAENQTYPNPTPPPFTAGCRGRGGPAAATDPPAGGGHPGPDAGPGGPLGRGARLPAGGGDAPPERPGRGPLPAGSPIAPGISRA